MAEDFCLVPAIHLQSQIVRLASHEVEVSDEPILATSVVLFKGKVEFNQWLQLNCNIDTLQTRCRGV